MNNNRNQSDEKLLKGQPRDAERGRRLMVVREPRVTREGRRPWVGCPEERQFWDSKEWLARCDRVVSIRSLCTWGGGVNESGGTRAFRQREWPVVGQGRWRGNGNSQINAELCQASNLRH